MFESLKPVYIYIQMRCETFVQVDEILFAKKLGGYIKFIFSTHQVIFS